jgi:N-carbamoyl-L-amino-acid hydrolase
MVSSQDLARQDQYGTSLDAAIRAVGGRPEALGESLRKPGSLRGYLELHIEQGPVLERAGTRLGIVSGIVGIRRYEICLDGAAAHAGTTPMEGRRDALAGSAELILAVERLARERAPQSGFVGTIGSLVVEPNAPNVVPGEARATVELRALNDTALNEAQSEVEALARELALRRGLDLTLTELSRTRPVELDGDLRALLGRAADAAGVPTLELSSGGGHDAGHVASLGPAAMVFIPCRDGLSHAPGEQADPTDIATGAAVMLRVVLELARRQL